MKITFYGRLGDIIGREIVLVVPADVLTVRDLRRMLAGLYPLAAEDLDGPKLRACIGDTIVSDDFALVRVEAVEFFPPLSGG